ncbi:FAD-binding and (Fe-S)-binding domain-containing protein [Propioniciclava coleopterorum]|uniref:FAD-binding and (Fe-S)-binding domain-containing protein n=1 Tax=Propioniciclava coleopterorum TaxID=2714937 RepID=UPI001FEC2367|nr:FAD-binding and (Fe-S)-binding domain-containing protein [Propioniciclava coleopterorum]
MTSRNPGAAASDPATALPGVDATTLTRGLYSTDASLYRVVPAGVAVPRDRAELEALVDAARAAGVPLTLRGAGTSCAGNAVGPGVVADVARHLTVIHELDADAALAVVDPGVVQDVLSRRAQTVGLRFGPDPSTFTRCTIGGMIGNNACGPRALGYGRTSDNVVALDVITGTGERLTLDSRTDLRASDSPTLRALHALVMANLGVIRTQFGRFGRQVSGYSLEWLLPENGFDVAKFLAGTEGTLAVVTRATVRLVADAPFTTMVALGYPTMPDAADAMPAILPFRPTAVEGMDARIVDVVRRTLGAGAVPPLPAGEGWVFVELTDDDEARLLERADALLATSGCLEGEVVTDTAKADRLWKIRSDGAGLAGVSLARPAYAGWEDAAVPPEKLGDYLRDFDALLVEHDLEGLPYGHFGDGCVHCRIDFPLTQVDDGGARYRAFVEAAAALVASYGGSLSGEHGDGRARSELLATMYSPEAIALFGQVKAIFDPDGLLNPGVLVDPAGVDADLRAPQVRRSPLFLADPGFVEDVHRCTGVGKCVAANLSGVMCPSWQATREEKDSTRGRARILQEMINGTLVTDGWRSPEVHEALDLCLSCKGCSRDCPTGTDMAAYKSRVQYEAFKGRPRPLDHYSMGWLPRWGRLVSSNPVLPRLANAVLQTPLLSGLAKRLAGVDAHRGMPRFAPGSRRAAARRSVEGKVGAKGEVVLWVDSFSDAFAGDHVATTAAVLLANGWTPRLLERKACCGLTWITTGQLDGATRELRNATDVLHPHVARGLKVVGTEPSCLAVWRSDALELIPDDRRVAEVAASVMTLAEFLDADAAFEVPDLSGHTIVAQPHCHEASVMGWAAEASLLAKTGAKVVKVQGCCGLAGNHGMIAGHYDFSVSVFGTNLGPALDAAGPDAIVLADGFSCRTQLEDLRGLQALTFAELLAAHHS